MTIIIKDRVKQTATAVLPTGALSLSGTPTGYVSFGSVLSSGDQTYYCVENGSAFEVGIGTYGADGANTLSRDTILTSSTGSRLSISGRATVFITVPAAKFPFTDPSGELNLALNTLSDVSLTAPASGESLVYNGSIWANTVITGYTTEEAQDAVGGILADTSSISFSYNDGTPSIAASVRSSGITDVMISGGIDATKIGSGSVSSTQFGYLNGVTSSLQTQLDSKYDSANPSGYLTSSVASATYQPLDSDLTTISSLTATTDNFIQSKTGAWASRTIAQVKSDLGLTGTNSGDQDLSGYLTTSSATTLLADKADLVGGVIPTAQIPAVAIVEYLGSVASEVAMLALVGDRGDWCLRSDLGTTWVLSSDDSSLLASWTQLLYPTAPVTSVAGRTGAVTLSNTDISGLGTLATQNGTFSGTSSGTNTGDQDLSSYLTSSTAASTYLPLAGGTLTGDLKFTDATYDIGKSGATRPRDAFFSRNVTVGSLATVGYIVTGYGNYTNPVFQIGGSSQGFGADSTTVYARTSSTTVWIANTTVFNLGTAQAFGWTASGSASASAADLTLLRDAANTLAQRNSTNAQTFNLYNTYTSATSLETFRVKANAGAAYQIGSAIGSAGGNNQAVEVGHWDTAGAFTRVINVSTNNRVGIGTSSPGTTLDVVSASGGINTGIRLIQLAENGTAVSSYISIDFSVPTSGLIGQFFATANNYSNAAVNLPANSVGLFAEATNGTALLGAGGANGDVRFNTGGYAIANERMRISSNGSITFTPGVSTTGSPTALTVTGAAHTTLTLSTEATDVNFNLARTVQFATGALTTQRAFRIQAPTYGFVGASTITTASTLCVSGPPAAGTNATITRSFAIVAEAGDIAVANTAKLCLDTSGYAWIQGTSASGGGYVVDFYNRYNATYPQMRLTSSGLVLQAANAGLFFTTSSAVGTLDTGVARNAAGVVELNTGTVGTYGDLICRKVTTRNTTTATSIEVNGTYSSSTSFEALYIKAVASNSFEIATAVGSAGGTTRGLKFGTYATATPTTLTKWAEFVDSTGAWLTYGGANFVYRFGDIATGSTCNYRKARGTITSPTAVLSGDTVAAMQMSGYQTTGYSGVVGQIAVYATENFTDSANGTKMSFATVATGGTTLVNRVTIENDGTVGFTKAVGWGSETTNTPSGTTQTIDLDTANHQTLALTSATGTVTATLTVPTRGSSSGTIIVKQHASAVKDITWAVSSGTIKWMGTEPDWAADAVSNVRLVSWRWDGSVMYLAATEVGT